jgi:hypothetical protein
MIDSGEPDVQIIGCPNGSNFDVIHQSDAIRVCAGESQNYILNKDEWQSAVIAFADAVRAFYDASLPKLPSDDFSRRGYDAMISEWDRRRKIVR